MEKNDDRRVRKTQNALYKALVEFLSEKDLSHITVKELTDRADIHRVTFYAHYQDIFALYNELEEIALKTLTDFVETDKTHTYKSTYEGIVDFIDKNRWICTLLFTNPKLETKVMDILEARYKEIWNFEEPDTKIGREEEFLISYNIWGNAAIIRKWVREGFKEPKEKITAYMERANRIFDKVSIVF